MIRTVSWPAPASWPKARRQPRRARAMQTRLRRVHSLRRHPTRSRASQGEDPEPGRVRDRTAVVRSRQRVVARQRRRPQQHPAPGIFLIGPRPICLPGYCEKRRTLSAQAFSTGLRGFLLLVDAHGPPQSTEPFEDHEGEPIARQTIPRNTHKELFSGAVWLTIRPKRRNWPTKPRDDPREETNDRDSTDLAAYRDESERHGR